MLTANRLDLALETAVAADISTAMPEAGAVLLPHKLLVDLLAEMSGEFVVLSNEPPSNKVEIRSGAGLVRLEGLDAGEFAMMPVVLTEQSVNVDVDPAWLADVCKRLTFSAATDDTRPTLTGIKVQVVDGQLEMAATDGFRLARWQETVAWGDVTAIIPAAGLASVLSVMEPAQLTFNCQMIRFRDVHTEATLRLIDGGYPDYTPIIALVAETCVFRAAKGDLEQAVMLADVIARGDKTNHSAQVAWKDDEIRIGTQYSQWGENTSVCAAQLVSGKPIPFGINAAYLGQAVGQAPGDAVEIIVPEAYGPIHVRGVGDDRWLSVIMPIRRSHI